MNREDIRNFILEWNLRFPIDKWWRDKHNVAFGSPVHRESCFIDQSIEYEEDVLFRKSLEEETQYHPNEGNWLKEQQQSENDWIKNSREQIKELGLDG